MALFSAVSSLNKDGFHACEVTAGMDISPALTTHDIRISCGEKSVAVTRETIGENAHTTVHEELGEQHEVGKSHAITRRGPNQPHGSSKSLTFISL
jgi:hypothetical protein